MTYIKLLTVLAGLALLTACGGSSPTTPANNSTGGDNSGGDNSGGDNSGGNNNGGGGGNPTDCTQTPFHNDCLTNNAPALALRQSRCLANPAIDPSCGGILTTYCATNDVTACPNVTTADWLASFTANGGTALPTTPNTTPTNEFLAISATTASSLTDAVPTTLFMTGSTTNGLAFFAENGAFYAGVLAGTNLGAPITAPITSARWTGQIRAASSTSNAILSAGEITDFGVAITFDGTNGTIKETFVSDSSAVFVYEIDGTFDANGIIGGSVAFGVGDATNGIHPTQLRERYSPGTLTGIIGQNGAVGVFHSDNENSETGSAAASFAGGFVVTPPTP